MSFCSRHEFYGSTSDGTRTGWHWNGLMGILGSSGPSFVYLGAAFGYAATFSCQAMMTRPDIVSSVSTAPSALVSTDQALLNRQASRLAVNIPSQTKAIKNSFVHQHAHSHPPLSRLHYHAQQKVAADQDVRDQNLLCCVLAPLASRLPDYLFRNHSLRSKHLVCFERRFSWHRMRSAVERWSLRREWRVMDFEID